VPDENFGKVTPELEARGIVKGYDYNKGVNFEEVLKSYISTGFQATNFGLAIEEIMKMIRWRLSDDPVEENDSVTDPELRKKVRCTIFLGYTSNMISCGVREIIRYLCQHRMVDCIVTTCGGIEEDMIKCMASMYHGDFALNGEALRRKGVNRIGNLLIPNDHYTLFEEWLLPILDQAFEDQKKNNRILSPSRLIKLMGKAINNEESVYYWCWKNKIPVMCPAITDGAVGDMIYMHSYKKPGLIMDVAHDIRKMIRKAVWAKKSGMIILGGGVIKHHICNANLYRNGADFSVFINTGNEFDGSDSGARPDEAISWGKIKYTARPVKLYAEASLVFPLLVGMTFAKEWVPKEPFPEKKQWK
jgi:deoxyhypusine synthase